MDFLFGLLNWLTNDGVRNAAVVLGVLVAVLSLLTAREVARKKQSADLLFTTRNDEKLQKGLAVIRQYHDASDKNLRSLADPEKFEDPDAVCIRYVLNHFEVVSIGIQAGIYDERMLKWSWQNLLVATYDRTEPLIKAVRERKASPTALQEFQWLAMRWKASPLKKKVIVRAD